MMRFPIVLMHSERNDKLCSENAYNVFSNTPRAELYPKQAAVVVCPPRSIKYDDSKQAVIQKFKNDSPPFRKWIDFLLNNDWIGRCKDIMLFHSSKYCTIATTKYNLQNKVASTKTTMFPDIAEGAKDSEN
ncbi:MAG: hypothetical protein M3382_04530 [Thermoproteota archaeon]|nr:hypothetical protein [Thermoproteota archaeon]